jgi:hypothetical protein
MPQCFTVKQDASKFWAAVAEFGSHVPELNDAGCSGYFYIVPAGSMLSASLLFVNQTSKEKVSELFGPMISALRNITTATVSYLSVASPTLATLLHDILPGDADDTGWIVSLGSRLISRDYLLSTNGPTRLIEALSEIANGPNVKFIGLIVAGGAVAENGATVDSAVNPAWRKTALHITWRRSWTADATLEEIQAVQSQITEVDVPLIKSLEPHMGAYLNEADANEVDFQESFWGHNYARLQEIKRKWDHSDLFISRRCVGSENRDDPGLCRLGP